MPKITQKQSPKTSLLQRLTQNKLGPVPLTVAVVVVVVALGSGTALAAAKSKPGDVLYSVKRTLEDTQLNLAATPAQKEKVYTSLVKERLTEVQKLLQEKTVNTKDVDKTLEDFNKDKNELNKLLQPDTASNDTHNNQKEAAHEVDKNKTQIDTLYETQQKALETQREELKKQQEAAVKAGNAQQAQALQDQVKNQDTSLGNLEVSRESAKNVLEQAQKEQEVLKEQQKQADEAKREADKKQQEATPAR
jgi:hypothetical protein